MFYQYHSLLLLKESSVELRGGTKWKQNTDTHEKQTHYQPASSIFNENLPDQSSHYLSETNPSATSPEHTKSEESSQ